MNEEIYPEFFIDGISSLINDWQGSHIAVDPTKLILEQTMEHRTHKALRIMFVKCNDAAPIDGVSCASKEDTDNWLD